jgi:hypothetical protein
MIPYLKIYIYIIYEQIINLHIVDGLKSMSFLYLLSIDTEKDITTKVISFLLCYKYTFCMTVFQEVSFPTF